MTIRVITLSKRVSIKAQIHPKGKYFEKSDTSDTNKETFWQKSLFEVQSAGVHFL